jgi:hypothetical protein
MLPLLYGLLDNIDRLGFGLVLWAIAPFHINILNQYKEKSNNILKHINNTKKQTYKT